MSRKHTLVLLQHAISDGRLLNICRSLINHGDEVSVIAYGTKEDAAILKDQGIAAYLLDTNTFGRLYSRWWRFLRFATSKLRTLHSDVVWAEDVFVFPAVIQHARKIQARVVYDCREIYTRLPHVESKSKKRQLLLFLERWGLQYTQLVFLTGELDIRELATIHPALPETAVLENRPPLSSLNVQVDPKINIRKHFDIADDAILCLYQGGVFTGRGLELSVRMLTELPQAYLVVVGDGPAQTQLQQQAEQLGVEARVHWVGRVNYTDLALYTQQADVGLCLIEPVSRSYELAKPNKMFEYAIAGLAGVYTDLPAMRDFVQQHQTGVVVPTDCQPKQLADAIVQASTLTLEYTTAYVHEHFAWAGQEPEMMRKLANI